MQKQPLSNLASSLLPLVGEDTLLTAAQVAARFGVSPGTLLRWVKLRRVTPVRVRLRVSDLLRLAAMGKTTSDLRFVAGDIANAIEASSFNEPGSRGHDAAMG